jgi:predicted ester cyclase
METQNEMNKAVVTRFNNEVIGQGMVDSFKELMDEHFINQSAPIGMDKGPQGMLYFFNELLRPAMPDLKVEIYQQLAEGDLVTTRKSLKGTHTGNLMGIPATGKSISIDVIDIVRLKNGKYVEHWGLNTLPQILAELQKAPYQSPSSS